MVKGGQGEGQWEMERHGYRAGEDKREGMEGSCTSGGGPMTESSTGSSTSPLSSPSSVRMVSTAKKYLRGPQTHEVSRHSHHEPVPLQTWLPMLQPVALPCLLSLQARWNGSPQQDVLTSKPTSPLADRGAATPITPNCQSSCRAASVWFTLLQGSPHDEIKLRASQHEDTQEGGDSTIHHRRKSVFQCRG